MKFNVGDEIELVLHGCRTGLTGTVTGILDKAFYSIHMPETNISKVSASSNELILIKKANKGIVGWIFSLFS